MSSDHNIDHPTLTNRQFGFSFAGIFTALSITPLLHGHPFKGWLFLVAAFLFLAAIIQPQYLSPINKLWAKFGQMMQFVTGNIALFIVFYTIITPTAYLVRLSGKDPLQLKTSKSTATYWISKPIDHNFSQRFLDQF